MDKKLTIILAVACLLGGALFTLIEWFGTLSEDTNRINNELSAYLQVRDIVEKRYVEPFDPDAFTERALEGAMDSLDEYSTFMPPAEAEGFRELTSAHFTGIGVQVILKSGILTVRTPWPGTPAYDAGILADDQFIKVDGTLLPNPMTDKEFQDVIDKRIKGKAGTTVNITVYRPSTGKEITFSVERREVHVPSVQDFRLISTGPPIAYLRLIRFSGDASNSKRAENSVHEIITALSQLQSQTKNGKLAGLILDLRDNHGGLLPQAVEICDLFITDGVIVSSRERTRETVFKARQDDTLWPDMPIVLLINGESASASEIVAGCLHDHKRAVLVGETSYGKGSVQSTFPIFLPPKEKKTGENAGDESNTDATDKPRRATLKVTIAKYYTPSGKNIHGTGIKPDVTVRLSRAEKVAIAEARDNLFVEMNRHTRRPDAIRLAVSHLMNADAQLTAAINLMARIRTAVSEAERDAFIRKFASESQLYNTLGKAIDTGVNLYIERFVAYRLNGSSE